MLRDCIREAMRNPREFLASFLTLVILYAAVFSVYLAGAAPVGR